MIFLLFFLLIIVSTVFIEVKFYTEYMYPVISSINVIFIFWIGISGIRQPKLFVSKNSLAEKENIESNFNENSKNKSNTNKIHYKELTALMVDEKIFLEPNLSLADLSIKLKIPQRNLSELIREKSDKNFNQFVNYYRVEEAKKLILDASYDHLNMLGIAFESGFNSKATFYSVFKKQTSQTPTLFKNKNLV